MSNAPEDRNRRVEDYVRGQADDETARQMEIEMLEDDDLFERVQTEDLLKHGFAETEQAPSSTKASGVMTTAPASRIGWALAASFGAVAVLLGVYALQLNERIETLQSPSTGLPVITLYEQRSLLPESDPALDLTGHEGPVLLEIDVSGYDHESFQLELVRQQSSMIWDEQVPDQRGYITVLAPEAQSIQSIQVRSPSGEALKSYTTREE